MTTMSRFLSTPSARRATSGELIFDCINLFLSTPSARRATKHRQQTGQRRRYFYPRPPRGGRPVILRLWQYRLQNFYPRPPRGGRPDKSYAEQLKDKISIHALREEGDGLHHHFHRTRKISIHALREEGDRATTSPRSNQSISIHALREEGDDNDVDKFIASFDFYPRPPRGGRPHGSCNTCPG